MATTDDLVPVLRKLRLSGVLDTLDLRVRQAVEDSLPFPEFLQRLLTDEIERRQAKQLSVALRRASFESSKSLEDFDFTFNPGVPKSKIIDLATCHFLSGGENVLIIGEAGVGKSHVAQALGLRACMLGHSALYTSAKKMFKDLRSARADESYDKRLLRFTSPAVLIIDDLGLQALKRRRQEAVHEAEARRHHEDPAGWLHDILDYIMATWNPALGRFGFGDGTFGLGRLRSAVTRLVEIHGATAARDIARGVLANFVAQSPLRLGGGGVETVTAILESHLPADPGAPPPSQLAYCLAAATLHSSGSEPRPGTSPPLRTLPARAVGS